MKKEKDLHKKLAATKWHKPNSFIYFLYYTIGSSRLLGKKYHPHYQIDDKMPKDKACFVIFNHQSRRDHAFVMHAAWPKKINIVCEYNEFFRSHLHMVFKLNSILPKKVFANDFLGIKAMNAIIKQGGCVALAPEGTSSIFGNNQPIPAGTGRFLKHYKIPVYCDDIKGSYLTNNKISEIDRIGEVYVKQYLLFSPEDLEKMSGEEIEAKINETFRHDDYKWNKEKRISYKCKKGMANNLQDICYRCPKCGHDLTMVSDENSIKCTHCGNGATVNEYYDLVPFDDTCVIPESPVDWMLLERKAIVDEIRQNPNFFIEEKMEIAELPKDHLLRHHLTGEVCGEGIFRIDHDGVHFKGIRHNEEYSFNLTYKEIFTLHICVDLKMFAIFLPDGYLEFHPEHRNVAKMMMTVEEMHRLHENYWKNFPWFDYLYEGYEK